MFTCGPGFFASAAGGGATDPYFANVVALLHFDGPNGSTTFTDQIATNTWTRNGSSTISTASSKFGGSSANFPVGTLSPISTTDKTALQMGTSDFTIEGWFNPVAPTNGFGVCYLKGVNSTGGLSIGVTPTVITVRRAGTTDLTASVSISTWSHVAVVRASGVLTVYLNGSSVATSSLAFDNNDTDTLYVGSNSATIGDNRFSYGGYIDDFRVTKGVARYTSNFTPPTAPFPNS
jgi:hypothetical protein